MDAILNRNASQSNDHSTLDIVAIDRAAKRSCQLVKHVHQDEVFSGRRMKNQPASGGGVASVFFLFLTLLVAQLLSLTFFSSNTET